MLEPFNEIANKFVNNLKPLADETMAVPMKVKFGEFALEVISKVYKGYIVLKYMLSHAGITFMQVAFGTDFTQQLRGRDNLKLTKGNETLTFLVDFILEGVEKSIRFPGYRVSFWLIVSLYECYCVVCVACSITIHSKQQNTGKHPVPSELLAGTVSRRGFK